MGLRRVISLVMESAVRLEMERAELRDSVANALVSV